MSGGSPRSAPAANASVLLRTGRAAYARHDWAEAFTHLSAADAHGSLSCGDLECLAISAFLVGRDNASTDFWTRAHHEYLNARDVPRAVRCAFWIILDLLTRGEAARANGWLARAQRLLDDEQIDCPGRGLILVLQARLRLRSGDVREANDFAGQAAELASRFDDSELAVFSRLARAQVEMRTGDRATAVTLFDEVMVATTVGDVSPIAIGVVYCAVIEGCALLFDVARAREWTRMLTEWCDSQPDMVPFRGQCLVHRAEVMRLSGDWHGALKEAMRACRWLTHGPDAPHPAAGQDDAPPFRYPAGAAYYQLAELHRVRGELTKADEAYGQASRLGHTPEPGLALLRLAEGQVAAAATAMRRMLEQRQNPLLRAHVLAAATEVLLAAGDRTAAREAATALAGMAEEDDVPYLRALGGQALGSVLLAESDLHAALAALRASWTSWQELQAPYEAARIRVLLGLCCRGLGDEDAARLEFDAAGLVFERLRAAPDLARLEALALPARRARAGLTRRERQVMGLIAAGRTNRAIAEELAISERTVDRHVSNILTKLGLPSRTAATAYAYEHGLL
ncbi:MAG TPA: response regulator transcription factor [Gemmatimonadaceae bacterium]|nr:response regulator transcription factor [Gemmatimonadaceae bacterium]